VNEFAWLFFGRIDGVIGTGGVRKTDQNGNADGDQNQQDDMQLFHSPKFLGKGRSI
jgi:hypothetical protein